MLSPRTPCPLVGKLEEGLGSSVAGYAEIPIELDMIGSFSSEQLRRDTGLIQRRP